MQIAYKGEMIMRIGIIRKVDPLGRITIPKEYRDFYHLYEKEKVCIIDTSEGLLITTPKYKVVKNQENGK